MKRGFSRGRRTKDWGPSSMTQFMDILGAFCSLVGWWKENSLGRVNV